MSYVRSERAILQRKWDGGLVRVYCAVDVQFYIDKDEPYAASGFVNCKTQNVYFWVSEDMPFKVLTMCGAEEKNGYKVVWRAREGGEPPSLSK